MVLNPEVETDVVYIDLADNLSRLRFSSFLSVLFLLSLHSVFPFEAPFTR
jgi:hypothetical protein